LRVFSIHNFFKADNSLLYLLDLSRKQAIAVVEIVSALAQIADAFSIVDVTSVD